MGRHSTHQQTEFVRSAVMWFLPWVLAAVVGIGALWVAVDAALGGSGASPDSDPAGRPAVGGDGSPTPDDDLGSPSPSPSPTPTPTQDRSGGSKKKEKPELISDGVSIQVLNGTSSSEVDDAIADKLEGLGFEIVAVNTWQATPATVVYWSTPDDQKAATLLADRFGWEAQPKPPELSSEVRLHVLIGADEATP